MNKKNNKNKNMMNPSFHTLSLLGLATKETQSVYHVGVRDNESTIVYKDKVSGVIYHNDYPNENYYKNTLFEDYQKTDSNIYTGDNKRRLNAFKNYYVKKNILDFGCGNGDFIRGLKNLPLSKKGLELNEAAVKFLRNEGIDASDSLNNIENSSLDTIFSFHVIEHLINPIETLKILKKKLSSNGKLIIEVPNANDFLLSYLKSEDFKKFTLWSEHLILHTKESLIKLLKYCGFKNVDTYGVQRYSVINHFNWLKHGSQHADEIIPDINSTPLLNAYEKSLDSINSTDTLIAVAYD